MFTDLFIEMLYGHYKHFRLTFDFLFSIPISVTIRGKNIGPKLTDYRGNVRSRR